MKYEKIFKDKCNYNDYRSLVQKIMTNDDLTYYKYLEPYKDNIKLLLDNYFDFDSMDFQREIHLECSVTGINYIDKVIKVCMALDDIKIDPKVFKSILRGQQPTDDDLLDYIMALYVPQVMSKNLDEYLDTCYSLFIYSRFSWAPYEQIDTGSSELDDIYKIMTEYLHNDPHRDRIRCHDKIIALILAYLHLNNKYSHDTFMYYIDNIDYYEEKLVMNNVYNVGIQFDSDECKYLFDNFESMFSTKQGGIR